VVCHFTHASSLEELQFSELKGVLYLNAKGLTEDGKGRKNRKNGLTFEFAIAWVVVERRKRPPRDENKSQAVCPSESSQLIRLAEMYSNYVENV
jgi:hypothetical protein